MARGLGKNRRGFANSAVTRSQISPIAAVELSDPVSLYLPFDSGVNDDSDNNHTVTAGGGAAISSTRSKFGGYSLNLDGTDDYLSVAASTDFDFGTGLFTIEGWIYSEKPQSENLYSQGIVYSGTTGSWSVSLGHLYPTYIRDKHTIQFYRYGTGSDQPYNVQTAQTVSRNAWHHFAVVRESATTIKIYVDGMLSATESSVASSAEFNSSGGDIEIGRNLGTTNTAHFVNGYIDDLRITKGVARYTENFIPPSQAVGAKLTGSNETNTTTDFTSLYLPFDSDLDDDSTNAFTGTAVGGASITTSVKKFGAGSLSLASGRYVDYGNNSAFDLGSGDFTFEMWVYHTGGNSIFGKDAVNAQRSYYLQLDSGKITFFFTPDGSTVELYDWHNGNVTSNNWHHIAVVRSGTQLYCFLDGVLDPSPTITGGGIGTKTISTNSANFRVGHRQLNNVFFNGYIDDFRYIKGYAKYTADFTPPTSAVGTSVSETVNDLTLLYLPFDDDSMEDQARNHTITKEGTVALSTSVKKFGTSSAYFAAADDELHIPGGKFNLGSSFTIEGWYYLTSYTTHSVAFQYKTIGSDTSVDRYLLTLAGSDGKLKFQIGLNGSSEYIAVGTDVTNSKLSLNTWTHVACVRDGANLYLFKDGVQIGITKTVSSSSLVTSQTSTDHVLVVGGSAMSPDPYPNHGMIGYIDDFRIIDGVALYTSNFTPPTSPVGLAVESGGVTTNTVDNKFLSSVWSLKDQNKKISRGEWIRNDAADTGVNVKGRVIKGAGLEVAGHRHFQGGNVRINAIGAGGHIGSATGSGPVEHDEMFGGFTSMEINITPGTPLNVIVGGGGEKNGLGSFGGGGAVGQPSGEAGSGGGYSGVFEGPVSQANAIAIAGGGGGGKGSDGAGGLIEGSDGAGGGLEGNPGGSTSPIPDYGRSFHGTGGTQSAGGVAGDIEPSSPPIWQGTNGSALQGGDGGDNPGYPAGRSGSGGGGYYGGGGGSHGNYYAGGGGGGSGYITPAAVGSPFMVTGGANGTLPTGLAGNSYGLVNFYTPSYPLNHGAVEIIDGGGPTVYTYSGSVQTHTVT